MNNQATTTEEKAVERPSDCRDVPNALLSAFQSDDRFRDFLMRVKQWGGTAPLREGKENDPTVLYAVQQGAIRLGKSRVGPLGIYTGEVNVTLTDDGWELVGR